MLHLSPLELEHEWRLCAGGFRTSACGQSIAATGSRNFCVCVFFFVSLETIIGSRKSVKVTLGVGAHHWHFVQSQRMFSIASQVRSGLFEIWSSQEPPKQPLLFSSWWRVGSEGDSEHYHPHHYHNLGLLHVDGARVAGGAVVKVTTFAAHVQDAICN